MNANTDGISTCEKASDSIRCETHVAQCKDDKNTKGNAVKLDVCTNVNNEASNKKFTTNIAACSTRTINDNYNNVK